MRSRKLRTGGLALLAGGLLLVAPAGAAAAASRPVAVTRGATSITPSTAAVHGTVRPNGASTTYLFEFGTTKLYGARTAAGTAPPGNGPLKVVSTITGLAPATTYHYRLIARNAKGISRGRDRTFHTRRQPLGVTLAATPNPIRPGDPTVLAGALTGTNNGGRRVVLQANPWPYTQGFANVANTQITGSTGGFSFPVISVGVNTQYRVLMPERTDIVSPIVVVGTKVRVTTHVHVTRGRHRGRVELKGSILPAADGTQVLIQKNRTGTWKTIASTVARHHSSHRSHYRRALRQRRPGRYRVFAAVQGAHSPNIGRTVRVRHVKR